jgi:hypothetical protein
MLLGLFLYVGLGACTTHDVRCDGPLQPINIRAPAPAHATSAEQRVTAP